MLHIDLKGPPTPPNREPRVTKAVNIAEKRMHIIVAEKITFHCFILGLHLEAIGYKAIIPNPWSVDYIAPL